MEPLAFLNLAHELSRRSGSEAALRTSVSRSYYALHNYIGLFISNQGFFLPKDAKKHDWIFQDLHNCNIKDIVKIASALSDLREERNDADYDLKIASFQEPNTSVLLYLKAKAAFENFQEIISDSKNRGLIVKEITAYREKIQRPK
jgi:hypothetical protein